MKIICRKGKGKEEKRMEEERSSRSIGANVRKVREKCGKARLVAVSKTKPAASVVEAYEEAGQRDFGENYVQELVDKSQSAELSQLHDIRWRFIGHLQTNKVKQLCTARNLTAVESLDSPKLAKALDTAWMNSSQIQNKAASPLDVMVQVNTSGEQCKSGVAPCDVVSIVKVIREQCSSLRFVGLMTIGESESGQRDFATLVQCRSDVAKSVGMEESEIELSMGMSADYELALSMGSTSVRVGSAIFGSRVYPPHPN